jgi:hypothetical protein
MAMKACIILAFMGIVFSTPAFAQVGKVQATIILTGVQQPIVIQDFTVNNESSYDALQKGKRVKLSFQDLKEITFLNPGRNYDTEVVFNDDRRETYLLQPASDIIMISETSVVELGHSKISRITFSPIPTQQPSLASQPIQQLLLNAQSVTVDRVILKNGDSLSGTVQNRAFPVRTAYGAFQLETPQIVRIEFDAKGPNTALVLLRSGDRLSGVVEVEFVRFLITTGEVISFDGKMIKTINFKR